MTPTPPSQEPAHLVRQIGLKAGIAVVVGGTIGSGIFKSPSSTAEYLPGPLPLLAVWLVGGLLVLCGSLSLGEVGSAFPYSGGLYVYIREAFGRLAAFLFAWSGFMLVTPSGIGAISLAFAQYTLRLASIDDKHPQFLVWSAGLAIGAILLITTANIVGVRFAIAIQNLTTWAKSAGLIVLILVAILYGLPKSGGFFQPLVPAGSFSPSMFGLALVSTLWAYDGWANCTYIAGEISNPRRNLSLSLLIGTAFITLVYVLANVAYLCVLPIGEIAKSSTVAAETMARMVGTIGLTFIVATVAISTFGTLNGTTLTQSRVTFAVSEDGLLFKRLGEVHPQYKTPARALLWTCILGIGYVILASIYSGSKAFTALTDAVVISSVPFYALGVASLFVFRRRAKKHAASQKPDAPLPDSLVDEVEPGTEKIHPHTYDPAYRVPLYPVIPLIFIGSMVFLLLNSILDAGTRVPTLVTLALVLLGTPLYLYQVSRRNS